MKKIFSFIICALLCAAGASAQTYTASEDGLSITYTKADANVNASLQPAYRSGNTYVIGNQVMNKYQYAGFLKNNCPQAFAKFNSGYTLSSIGWGFLAGGLGMEIGSCFLRSHYHTGGECYHTDLQHHIGRHVGAWGHTFVVASVPLLVIGYCKQHNSVSVYNSSIGQPYFSLNATEDGVGIAYNF